MKSEEKSTLLVDFKHLSYFQFSDGLFIEKMLGEYTRFEPYLRRAATQFLAN